MVTHHGWMYIEITPRIKNLPAEEIEEDILKHFGNVTDLLSISDTTTLSENDKPTIVISPSEDVPNDIPEMQFSYLVRVTNYQQALSLWKHFPWRTVTYGQYTEKSDDGISLTQFAKDASRPVFRDDLSKPDQTYGDWNSF